jgi:hypothetical protein
MDEISIYNRALGDAEIQIIYDAGVAGRCKTGPPVIISQPADQQAAVGLDVSFSVVASGFAP